MRFEAAPHRDRVAHECEIDSLAGQDLGLAGEQQPRSRAPLLPLFYLVEMRDRQLLE